MATKEKERNPAVTRRTTRTAPRSTAKRSAAASTRRAKVKEQEKTAPDVVYLPPKPFSRNRFILRLATVVAVVIALTLGLSVFFKVDSFVVSGNDKYTAWDISQAAGIKAGDNLLTFSRAQAAGKIIAALPYVDSVRIGIKLPGTVKIDIVEVKVPYAVKAWDESWWLISASGKVIEKAQEGAEEGYTKILGVQLADPEVGDQAVAFEPSQTQTDPEGNAIPVTVTQAQRLKTALDIVEYLELNGVIGKAASVDVNDLADIQIWYAKRYQVKLGSETDLAYKVSCMKYVIDKLDDYQSGVLDISFTTWPDKVGYTPFNEESDNILEIP